MDGKRPALGPLAASSSLVGKMGALVAELVSDQQKRGGLTLIATNDTREVALAERTISL